MQNIAEMKRIGIERGSIIEYFFYILISKISLNFNCVKKKTEDTFQNNLKSIATSLIKIANDFRRNTLKRTVCHT